MAWRDPASDWVPTAAEVVPVAWMTDLTDNDEALSKSLQIVYAAGAAVTAGTLLNAQIASVVITNTGSPVAIGYPVAYTTWSFAWVCIGGTGSVTSAIVTGVPTTSGFSVECFNGSTILSSGDTRVNFIAIGI